MRWCCVVQLSLVTALQKQAVPERFLTASVAGQRTIAVRPLPFPQNLW